MFNLSLKNLNDDFCIRNSDVIAADSFMALVSGLANKVQDMPQRLALCFNDSYLFAAAVFACLSSEKSVVILPNNQSGVLEKLKSEYDAVLTEESFLNLAMGDPELDHFISADASLVFYTSGSSGEAKKVAKRFENFFVEVLQLENVFKSKVQDSVFFATVTHQHIYGFLFKVLWPICMQRTWLAAGLDYPEQVLQLAKKVSSFTLISTPAFLKRNFVAESGLGNCKAVFSSGGLLNFEAAELSRSVFSVSPIEVYGSTESGGVAFRERTQEHQAWKTFSVVQVSKNDRDQLVVTSPYFDDVSLSMGDRVEFTADGFELLGRIDDIVKVEEKRVSLSEMNSRIISSGFVKESATIALEAGGRQQLACLATLSPLGNKVLEDKGMRGLTMSIREYLKPYFESVVIPKKFRFVDRLPYNEQSKLLNSELVGYFHEHG